MLGYVQNMGIYDILSEVNINIDKINQDLLKQKKSTELTFYLSHPVKSDNSVELRLEHIWLDLRKFY